MRYLIEKEYTQSSQRDTRTARRTQQKRTLNKKEIDNKTSPFVQLMSSKTPLDDSSTDDSIQESTNHETSKESLQDNSEHNRDVPSSVTLTDKVTTPDNDISPFPSDVAKHAEALEKTMDSAMAELKDPEPIQPHDVLEAKLESLIKQSLQQQMKHLI